MNERLKEPRIYLCILVYLLGFLPYMSADVGMSIMGMDASSSADVNVYTVLMHTFSGYIVLLLPIVMLVFEFLLSEKVRPRIIYMICGILGVICLFLSTALYINIGASGGNEYAQMEMDTTYKIGFWLELLTFLAIVVITAMKDFSLNKNTIQEKGFSNALKDATSQMASEAISVTNEIKTISKDDFNLDSVKDIDISGMKEKVANALPKVTCPNCGAEVLKGKKFCAKCGTKMEIREEPVSNVVAKGETGAVPKMNKAKSEMTVSQVLARVKDVACENCGTKVGAGIKFCPDCGEKIVIKIPPKNCVKCNAQLVVGRKFCPDCGEKVVGKELQTNCLNCNAELLFGKKFCVECGTKIEE